LLRSQDGRAGGDSIAARPDDGCGRCGACRRSRARFGGFSRSQDEPPRQRLLLRCCRVIVGRGPFALAEERRHLEQHAVEALVCKASGGVATEAKLVAARELGVPVVMLRRPPPEPGTAVETIAAALDWLAAPSALPVTGRVS
jgi:Precorrin-6x reductase CbiJ/CobK